MLLVPLASIPTVLQSISGKLIIWQCITKSKFHNSNIFLQTYKITNMQYKSHCQCEGMCSPSETQFGGEKLFSRRMKNTFDCNNPPPPVSCNANLQTVESCGQCIGKWNLMLKLNLMKKSWRGEKPINCLPFNTRGFNDISFQKAIIVKFLTASASMTVYL
jgi:hypothetical protein